MKTNSESNKQENVITIDTKHKKVYFNGNEVVKISFNFEDGKFLDFPYYSILVAAVDAKASNIQDYLDNNFVLYAVIYKDSETKKEHLVVWEYGKWNEVGSWDSIKVRTTHEFNESMAVYGINNGKRVDTLVLEKISLLGFSLNDLNNADTINLGYSVRCYKCLM